MNIKNMLIAYVWTSGAGSLVFLMFQPFLGIEGMRTFYKEIFWVAVSSAFAGILIAGLS